MTNLKERHDLLQIREDQAKKLPEQLVRKQPYCSKRPLGRRWVDYTYVQYFIACDDVLAFRDRMSRSLIKRAEQRAREIMNLSCVPPKELNAAWSRAAQRVLARSNT